MPARRVRAGWLLCALLAIGAARAEQSREVPYKDLARMQLMLQKVDADHVFSSSFSVDPAVSSDRLSADLRVEVVVDGKAVPVPVDPDGRMHLPVRQDWVDAGARLRVNQPKGKVLLGYHFKARNPPGTRMRYARLAESAEVMARGIREEAGLLGFLAPKPRALDIRFPPGPAQELVLRFADGTSKRYRAVAKGDGGYNGIELPWNPDWRDAEVVLSAPIGGIVPLLD
jgi:hypothetical protein